MAPNENPPDTSGLGSSFEAAVEADAPNENPPDGFLSSSLAAEAGAGAVEDPKVKPPLAVVVFFSSSLGDAAEVAFAPNENPLVFVAGAESDDEEAPPNLKPPPPLVSDVAGAAAGVAPNENPPPVEAGAGAEEAGAPNLNLDDEDEVSVAAPPPPLNENPPAPMDPLAAGAGAAAAELLPLALPPEEPPGRSASQARHLLTSKPFCDEQTSHFHVFFWLLNKSPQPPPSKFFGLGRPSPHLVHRVSSLGFILSQFLQCHCVLSALLVFFSGGFAALGEESSSPSSFTSTCVLDVFAFIGNASWKRSGASVGTEGKSRFATFVIPVANEKGTRSDTPSTTLAGASPALKWNGSVRTRDSGAGIGRIRLAGEGMETEAVVTDSS